MRKIGSSSRQTDDDGGNDDMVTLKVRQRKREQRREELARDWWDQPGIVEGPNPDSPGTERLLRRQQRFRRLLIVDLAAAPILASIAIVEMSHPQPAPSSLPPVSTVQATSRIAVDDWLASGGLPHGHIVGWAGASPIAGSTAEDATWLVASLSGEWRVTWEVSGTSVIAGPTLAFVTAAPSPPSAPPATPWPSLTNATTQPPQSGALTQAVQTWAQAFADGNATALALATGDSSGSGLTTLADATYNGVTASAYAPLGTGNPPSFAVEQVVLSVTFDGAHQPTSLTYDVLVHNPDSSAPAVVAWGPPGSGPTLKPIPGTGA